MSEQVSPDPMTLTSQRGCDFDIADDGDGFMLGMTPVAEPATWMWIDRTQATALRNWLNQAIPNE